jgi:hypothetical protein
MEEKEILFAWAKTLLSVYRYLNTVTDAIDNLVLKQAVNSGFYGNGYYNSTYNCANKLINLTERKKNLYSVKIIVEDAMVKLKESDSRILVLAYFDCLKSVDIANVFKISIRTFFRKKNNAILSLASIFKILGITSAKLHSMLQNEEWLLNIFNKNLVDLNLNDNNNKEIVIDYKLINGIIKDLQKTSSKNYIYS